MERIRLDQHAVQIQAAEQLFQRRTLTGFVGVVGLLGEGDTKGSIEIGKFADLTVLSDDIFSIPPQKLKEVRTLKTIVGGRVVYEASA